MDEWLTQAYVPEKPIGLSIEDIINELLRLPNIQWVSFRARYTGWNFVAFSRPFFQPPAVVACQTPRVFTPPSIPALPDLRLPRLRLGRISAPAITLPDLPEVPDISLPAIEKPDYVGIYTQQFESKVREGLRRIGAEWILGVPPFSQIFHLLAQGYGFAIGSILSFLWDLYERPKAEKWNAAILSVNNTLKALRTRLNTAINQIEQTFAALKASIDSTVNATNTRIETFEHQVNSTLEAWEDRWNSEIRTRITQTVQEIQQNLLGLVGNLAATPTPVRNVSNVGAEVYAVKDATVYVIAIGR